jgi:ubiquitin-activating enzyme E1
LDESKRLLKTKYFFQVDVRASDAPTIGALLEYLRKHIGIDVIILSSGNAQLYNQFFPAHKKRKDEKVADLYASITKAALPVSKRSLALEANGEDVDDGVDLTIPTIRYLLN